MGKILVERLPAEKCMPRTDLVYVDVLGLHKLFDSLAFKANVILSGPPGIGKSLSLATFAAKMKCPIVTFDCSEDVRRPHLIGTQSIVGDETPFFLGPLPTMVDIANEFGMCIGVLEEISALTPQSQKIVNGLADFRQAVTVNEVKEVYRLKKGAKLWLTGTMNTVVFGGVYALNHDLKSRFRLVSLAYPPVKEEKRIVSEMVKAGGLKCEEKIADKILLLAHQTRQNAIEYQLSTRDIIQVLEDVATAGLGAALQLVLGKFEGDDQNTVREWIKSIFKES